MNTANPDLRISSAKTTAFALSVGLGDVVQQAHRDQLELEKKLTKDRTKTKSARQLFAAQAAEKRISGILKRVEQKQKDLNGELYQYVTRIEKEMVPKSTTDLVILNSYASVLKDMDVGQVTELARQGDVDAIRSTLLVPALKLNEKFSRARDVLTTAAEQAILGDDYQTMEGLKEQRASVDTLEVNLLTLMNDYKKEIERISENVVQPDEMPQVG